MTKDKLYFLIDWYRLIRLSNRQNLEKTQTCTDTKNTLSLKTLNKYFKTCQTRWKVCCDIA